MANIQIRDRSCHNERIINVQACVWKELVPKQKGEARSVFLQKLSPICLGSKAFPNSSRDSRTLLSVHVGNNNGVPASIVFQAQSNTAHNIPSVATNDSQTTRNGPSRR